MAGLWERASNISGLLSAPGLWLAGFIYPEGIHTDSGGSGFIVFAAAINLLVYSLVACLVMVIWAWASSVKEHKAHKARPAPVRY